ncbi:unnamed protein product [Rhizophagus irregularis]|uniref:Uncharacterized protein n=1 Tax=Rhizophagus irregularis TaxID=588596 RepID=A0A2N1N9Z7_9GLOM|nr:hypothetical protein RhiirC2_779340 [Rhizophagus irregularis]CAB4388984.1 unnamed protein product [Rhizophagus irregularis]CAB5384747.1 unnamed protein product [Rhizophagus irregularis]
MLITQQDFLNWTKERYNKPITIHKYIKQEGNPLILNTNHLELKKECLDQFNNNDDFIINNKTTINLGPKDVWRKYSNNILMIDNLMKLLNVKEEVLLIRHLLPVPLFHQKEVDRLSFNKYSSTFHIITNYHHDAIKLLNGTFNLNTWVSMKTLNYLFNEFPDYENEIIEELQGSGIQGIFDKLILTNSNYFISGPEGCAHVKSFKKNW